MSARTELLDLESQIKSIEGVLGCVILVSPEGRAGEIQVFTERGRDKAAVESAITERVDSAGLGDTLRVIHVFELEADSQFGDRETLQRALELAEQEARIRGPIAEVDGTEEGTIGVVGMRWDASQGLDHRPVLQRVILSSSGAKAEAEVALELSELREVTGSASGEKTPHGLSVISEATLQACSQLVDGFNVKLIGASFVTISGAEAILVLVNAAGLPLLGAALVRQAPATEATVRATLDAVNRVLVRESR